jgi:FKBP-type peptidyl-prolyl cis-trans isomerase FklB
MKTSGTRNLALLLALLAAANVHGSRIAAAAEATPSETPPKPPAVTPEEISYDVGLTLGSQLEHNGMVPMLSQDAVIRGLKDAMAGRPVAAAQRDTALRFMHDARDALAEKNRAAAREFLARNAKQPGVKTTPSGLQYRVLAAGDVGGVPPSPADEVTVRYRASLADGTEFDRSDAHDRPAVFRVNNVLKGWQEALLAMKRGAKWQLFVPPELSYGVNPPPAVQPGALLIYELELLAVEPAAPMDPAAIKRRPIAGAKAPAQDPPH